MLKPLYVKLLQLCAQSLFSRGAVDAASADGRKVQVQSGGKVKSELYLTGRLPFGESNLVPQRPTGKV